MDVIILCDKLNVTRGGSNHSLDLVAGFLSERGHDVRVVTLNFVHDNELPVDPPYEIVEDPIEGGNTVTKARQLYRKLPDYDAEADLLHIFNPALLPIAGLYRARQGTTPIVGRLNTYDVFCTNLTRMTSSCFERCSVAKKFQHDDNPISRRLSSLPEYVFDTYSQPRLMNEVDRLFALSPAVKRIYDAIGVEGESIEVVPNCYDPGFQPTGGSLPFDRDAFTALYVDRLGKEKRADLLVESLERLDSPSDYRLEIVGEGPLREELSRRVADLDRTDIVTFHGWIDHEDLPAYYRAADLFVHPGRWPEPFGRTIIEAMQCSCPVVTSDVGAPPWIVGDDASIFERGNVTDLARTIGRVAAEDRSTYTDDYPDRLAEFSPDAVLSKVERLYRETVEGDLPR